MEDAVSEAESLLRIQEEEKEQKEEDSKHKDSEAEDKHGAETKGGLLDHIIHNLVSPLSPRAGDVNQKEVEVFESNDGARSENEVSGSGSEEEVGNVSNGGGGLMKNVISNFFHQGEQAHTAENVKKNEEEMVKSVDENAEVKKEDENEGSGSGSEEEVGNVNNGSGRLIKNVISNFFHQSEQAQVAENENKNEEEMVKSVEENAEVKKEDEGGGGGGGGGGGIIGNIVSHLPTSFPDDVAPTTDEASILIHSIIHD